jgi:hypothetical protein
MSWVIPTSGSRIEFIQIRHVDGVSDLNIQIVLSCFLVLSIAAINNKQRCERRTPMRPQPRVRRWMPSRFQEVGFRLTPRDCAFRPRVAHDSSVITVSSSPKEYVNSETMCCPGGHRDATIIPSES